MKTMTTHQRLWHFCQLACNLPKITQVVIGNDWRLHENGETLYSDCCAAGLNNTSVADDNLESQNSCESFSPYPVRQDHTFSVCENKAAYQRRGHRPEMCFERGKWGQQNDWANFCQSTRIAGCVGNTFLYQSVMSKVIHETVMFSSSRILDFKAFMIRKELYQALPSSKVTQAFSP